MKTNGEILEIFGEYEKMMDEIKEKIQYGETSGTLEWFFYREEYDTVTPEMEEIFGEEDEASIIIEWTLDVK